MGTAKKVRKETRAANLIRTNMKVQRLLEVTTRREAVLLRAMYEVVQGAGGTYAIRILRQMYGDKILDHLKAEISSADKKAKGLDKVILTGTEAME